MGYELNVSESEQVVSKLAFSTRGSEPLVLVISNQALYLPRKKFIAVDPNYLERVPIPEISEVRISRVNPISLWIVAAFMFLGGAITTALMLWPLLHGQKSDISGYPPAVAICGLVIPFIVRNRYGISIARATRGPGFKWNPPLLVDKKSRTSVSTFLDDLVTSCREVGIHPVDERGSISQEATLGKSNAATKYPTAGVPADNVQGVLSKCPECDQPIVISRWDHLNGFLLQCPHCHRIYGKPWKVQYLLFGSLFFNALTFFFTMRPMRALVWALGFALLWAGVLYVEDEMNVPDWVQLILFGIAILGPVAINAVIAIRHEIDLSTAVTIRR